MSTKYKAPNYRKCLFHNHNNSRLARHIYKVKSEASYYQALRYCQINKGLEIYAYCIMHGHLHLLCKATDGFILSEVIREFNKHTSKNSPTCSGRGILLLPTTNGNLFK